jgi:hypothetical protein
MGAVALSCASCGHRREKVYPVQGKVFVDGKPATGAVVFFHPESQIFTKGDQPHGVVDGEGVFHLTTYKPKDGAPSGKYKITVFWEKKPEHGDCGEIVPLEAYADPAASPLNAEVPKATTVLEPFYLVFDPKGG